MTRTILILGPTGRFGRNSAEAFRAAGWQVRRFNRKTDDLAMAARGVDVILNGWNPPYTRWAAELPGLTRQVIAAAKSAGATVILPGNVYVFGTSAPPRLAHDTPHGATNPLGRLRIEMEAAYRRAGLRVILLRAGDFIDVEASGNWFDQIMVKNLHKGRFTYPGDPEIPHAWAYLPDLARAAVALAAKRHALPAFADIPFPGYTLTGRELAEGVAAASGHEITLKRMNWRPVQALSPFWPMGRRILEMRYLWNKPHFLDGALFEGLLPDFRPTPLAEALRRAIPSLSGEPAALPPGPGVSAPART